MQQQIATGKHSIQWNTCKFVEFGLSKSRICSLYISKNEHLQVKLSFSSPLISFSCKEQLKSLPYNCTPSTAQNYTSESTYLPSGFLRIDAQTLEASYHSSHCSSVCHFLYPQALCGSCHYRSSKTTYFCKHKYLRCKSAEVSKRTATAAGGSSPPAHKQTCNCYTQPCSSPPQAPQQP